MIYICQNTLAIDHVPSRGQRHLRKLVAFFSGKTRAGARWLRAKRANRLRVLRTKKGGAR